MSRTEIQNADRDEVAAFIEQHWRSRLVMSRGRQFYPHQEEGFIERSDGKIVGLLTYHIEGDVMEMLTLNAMLERKGIGSALMLSAIERARERNCTRIVMTSTNDNLQAIGFYQRLGFRMVAIHLDAVEKARKFKPQIPETGERGIPVQDEIVMELVVRPYLAKGDGGGEPDASGQI